MVAAVRDFFENDRIYKAFNCTLVTLIPKNEEAKTIKEYRPIAGCTTVYKIISKIITARMGRVMDSIVGKNQAAFVPGQKIHNHILLAYELIKGYSRKGGTPCCMMQIDLQKERVIMKLQSLILSCIPTSTPCYCEKQTLVADGGLPISDPSTKKNH